MNKNWKYIILISIILNVFFGYKLLKPEELNRIPPWHPFELNSELTLKSIVRDGYRFAYMPCGQVQYTKQIGDTIIQYEIIVDCEKYKGRYNKYEDIFEEEDVFNNKEILYKTREEEIIANKYYPWKLNEIDDCYQKINWRYFSIFLGAKIDSSFVINYVKKKGGHIVKSTENWNIKKGGNFMVFYEGNKLYSHCKLNYNDKWVFNISSEIPQLNQKSILKEKMRRKKIDNYFSLN